MANAIKIEAKIISTGTWIKIQIVSVTEGYSQTLKDGKWVNTTLEPQIFEEEVLTFGRCFSNETEATKFMSTKSFNRLFTSIQKNWI